MAAVDLIKLKITKEIFDLLEHCVAMIGTLTRSQIIHANNYVCCIFEQNSFFSDVSQRIEVGLY